ncbi:MAG: hypothetical protein KDD50_03975 [Bdellovibrionales bacterium]|nr:hypothetical protein [Bdellovibrionales bacterium]
MRKFLKFISLFLVCFALALPGFGKGKKKKSSGQKGIIAVEGAAIYKSPNFDSPILDYFDKGVKVLISVKVYPGSAGFGSFYKIKIGQRKYGYIADTEVAPTIKREGSRVYENPEVKDVNRMPIDMQRYIGLGIGYINYTEEFEGRRLSQFLPAYGLKISGPGTMGFGPPLDFEVLIAPAAPSYYSQFADQNSKTSGFLLLGNVVLNLDLYVGEDSQVYYGLGIMSAFSKFDVPYQNEVLDSQELRMGALFHLGTFFRFGSWGLRFEGKYYYEREKYLAGTLGIQTEY